MAFALIIFTLSAREHLDYGYCEFIGILLEEALKQHAEGKTRAVIVTAFYELKNIGKGVKIVPMNGSCGVG